MVVFTCSHCGDSVHKPKVEKHYETKCRNNYPDLCCVDCLKDFRGDEHKAHTKCVSEAERYGGKNFMAKPGQNKGEKKQNAWIEIVQSVLDENKNISGPLRNLLEKVSKQPNTPRKESKFINFVKSMDKRANPNDVTKAWSLLSEKLSLIKVNIQPVNGTKAEDKTDVKETEDDSKKIKDADLDNSAQAENNIVDTKKKSKKNKKAVVEETEETSAIVAPENDVHVPAKKTKKQKKNDAVNGDDSLITDDSKMEVESNINGIPDTKKNKKQKKNSMNISETNDESILNGDNSIVDTKSNKSKKMKHVTEDVTETITDSKEIVVSEKPLSKKELKEKRKREKYEAELQVISKETKDTDMNGTAEPAPETKKSKKRKLANEENIETSEAKIEEKIEIAKDEPSTKKAKVDDPESFDWVTAITSVLSGKNKEISLKKLEKKVMNEYCGTYNITSITERINKKFKKSLKNIENIQINNDKVSVCA